MKLKDVTKTESGDQLTDEQLDAILGELTDPDGILFDDDELELIDEGDHRG